MSMSNVLSGLMARRKLLCASLIAALTGGAVVARAWQDAPNKQQYAGQQQSTARSAPPAEASGTAQFFNVQQPATAQSQRSEPAGIRANNIQVGLPGLYQTAQVQAYNVSREQTEQDAKIRKLLGMVKQADEDQKAALTDELTELLSQQFDQRHEAHEERLEALKASVEQAQVAIDTRAENRDKIIERRAKELLGEPDPDRWDYNPGARFPSSTSPARYYNYSSRFPTSNVPSAVRPVAPASPRYQQQYTPRIAAPTPTRPPVSAQLVPSTPGPGVRSNNNSWTPGPGTQNSLRVLQSQVENAAAALKDIERLHKNGVISSTELREAQGSLIEADARLKATQEALETRLQSAKIDLEAELADLQLLREQMRKMKTGTSENFDVKRSMTRGEANIRKAELELNLLSKQLDEFRALEKAAKASEDAGDDSEVAKETEL